MKKAWVRVTYEPRRIDVRAIQNAQSNIDTEVSDWNFYRLARDQKVTKQENKNNKIKLKNKNKK